MKNKMPQMPSVKEEHEVEELETPVHKQKVKLNSHENEVSSEVKIPIVPKNGIDVVATRKGFYNQLRLNEGDAFKINSIDELGEWMKCVDPVMEKQRKEIYNNKKAKK